MSARTVPQDQRARFIDLLTVAVGLLQAALAFSFAFLPVFTTCMGSANAPLDCRRITYGEQGGTSAGYAVFLVMIVVGIGLVVSTRLADSCRFRWLALAVMAAIIVLGAWGVGLLFLPGGLLLLLAALACRQLKHAG